MSILISILLFFFLTANIIIWGYIAFRGGFVTLGYIAFLGGTITSGYIAFLGAMMFPSFQSQFIYLCRPKRTVELEKPERFGFLYKQVTPFYITTDDNIRLYAWHILPLSLYRRNEKAIHQNSPLVPTSLLQNDPKARLIISMHGTAGNLASGGRPLSYRVLSSASPDHIHILAFDYRGFGLSSGTPSESGLLIDAIAVFKWAVEVANISPERIVIFGHSLGSAVAIALANELARQTPAISFAGIVVTGAFSDLLAVSKTYRILGFPIFSPIVKVRPLFNYYARHLKDTWLNKDRIGEYARGSYRYHITFIHAENDPIVPAAHANSLFWHAVKATSDNGISFENLEAVKAEKMIELGEGGWAVEWQTEKGVIRQDMLKRGGHNPITLYPVVGNAVLRAFQAIDPEFQL